MIGDLFLYLTNACNDFLYFLAPISMVHAAHKEKIEYIVSRKLQLGLFIDINVG